MPNYTKLIVYRVPSDVQGNLGSLQFHDTEENALLGMKVWFDNFFGNDADRLEASQFIVAVIVENHDNSIKVTSIPNVVIVKKLKALYANSAD